MENINSVAMVGNIVSDAKMDKTVLQFSVAINSTSKENDEYVDYPNYIGCVMFGKRAEAIFKYLKKGVKVAVHGKLHQSRWEDSEGKKRSRTEVWVDNIEFMQHPKKAVKKSDDDELPFY